MFCEFCPILFFDFLYDCVSFPLQMLDYNVPGGRSIVITIVIYLFLVRICLGSSSLILVQLDFCEWGANLDLNRLFRGLNFHLRSMLNCFVYREAESGAFCY